MLTVQGDSLLASNRPMRPWLVTMLALTCAGSVGILPVRGGLTGLAAESEDAGYLQLVPSPAVGLNAGNGGTEPGDDDVAVRLSGALLAVGGDGALGLC